MRVPIAKRGRFGEGVGQAAGGLEFVRGGERGGEGGFHGRAVELLADEDEFLTRGVLPFADGLRFAAGAGLRPCPCDGGIGGEKEVALAAEEAGPVVREEVPEALRMERAVGLPCEVTDARDR